MADVPPTDPASAAPVFTLASWGKRAAAFLIDVAPAVGISMVALILDSIGFLGLMSTLASIAVIGYWVWQWYNQGITGQTIGKKYVGIKVLKEADASLLGPGLSIGRGFLHVIDSLPCCFIPIGFLWPLWDQKRQTFTDKILTTVVVEAN
jgi:uncharacterized RDD family membrane protein YckC